MALTVSSRPSFLAIFWVLTILGLSSIANGEMPMDRVTQPINNANVTQLRGNIHPLAQPASDRGSVDGTTRLERIKLLFRPTVAQQHELDVLLAQQQDPGSPNYHKWLTPEQFGDRFGLSQGDIKKVAAWLESQGFAIAEIARGRNYIAFNGTAGLVAAAFHTQIHQYNVNGEWHYANATEPSLPIALLEVVSGIGSLHNFGPKPKLVKPKPRVTSSVTGNHFMQPGDFATIYNLNGLYSSGIDGTGQTIAVMGQTDLVTSNGSFTDIVTFRTNSGLSAPNLQTILVSSDPGIVQGDIDEANLDVEWSGGIAKNATILFVIGNATTGGGAFDALQYAVSNNLAPVISISYGLCEPQLDSTTQSQLTMAGQQANAQGQTIVAPSGDGGAADCDTGATATQGLAIDFPASMPYATAAGGSEFNGDGPGTVTLNSDGTSTAAATQYWSGSSSVSDTSATALSYIPEIVWNDTATDGSLSAGGGGLSILFPQPSWQNGLPAITNGKRGIPDISFSASADHVGYLICSQGSCSCGFRNSCTVSNNTNQGTFDSTGGTSASVPTFAAVVALINQQTNDRQGNVNPVLYSLATSAPNAFHDIDTGNNIVPCKQGSTSCPATAPFQFGYSAGFGYDLASGLGSPNVGALLAAWGASSTPAIQINTLSSSLTVTSGGMTSNPLTVIPVGGLSQATGLTINLSCSVSSSLPGVTCSVSPTSLTSAGPVSVTINAPQTAENMSGTVTITATSSTGVTQILVITVNVQIPLQFVAVTPCRVVDTRNPDGAFGGPAIQGETSRDFPISQGACNITSTAAAYSLNVTAVPHGPLGFLTVWPSGQNQPLISTLNSYDGRVKANAAIVPAGSDAAISVYASSTTDVVLDINGYFVPTTENANALAFYPVTPCRVVDTRTADGPLGGPFLTGEQPREFPILSSSCNVPSTAQAYSMNFTAVPHGPLFFLTVWPSDQPQPLVSTLNAYTGQITANAAIVPAASSGDISAYVSNDSDLVIDVDGYFAPAASGGLSLYPSTPCRVLDTRSAAGAFANDLTVNVAGSPCGVSSGAQAYVFNATVVPEGSLGFLALWPNAETQPLVSTLNSEDGATTSNMAIVPTLNGLIDAYASSVTQFIVDISSFFAP